MNMELLVIKCGDRYARVKEDAHQLCGIDKASVYPMEKLVEVRRLAAVLRHQGLKDISIRKLVLTEEPLEGKM